MTGSAFLFHVVTFHVVTVHTDKLAESRIRVECPELTKMGESNVRRGYRLGEDVQGEMSYTRLTNFRHKD